MKKTFFILFVLLLCSNVWGQLGGGVNFDLFTKEGIKVFINPDGKSNPVGYLITSVFCDVDSLSIGKWHKQETYFTDYEYNKNRPGQTQFLTGWFGTQMDEKLVYKLIVEYKSDSMEMIFYNLPDAMLVGGTELYLDSIFFKKGKYYFDRQNIDFFETKKTEGSNPLSKCNSCFYAVFNNTNSQPQYTTVYWKKDNDCIFSNRIGVLIKFNAERDDVNSYHFNEVEPVDTISKALYDKMIIDLGLIEDTEFYKKNPPPHPVVKRMKVYKRIDGKSFDKSTCNELKILRQSQLVYEAGIISCKFSLITNELIAKYSRVTDEKLTGFINSNKLSIEEHGYIFNITANDYIGEDIIRIKKLIEDSHLFTFIDYNLISFAVLLEN